MTHSSSQSLANAPIEVQLAVDLIYLLESHNIQPTVALAALDIVRHDIEKKRQLEQTTSFEFNSTKNGA